jgi:hypothetical protein
MVWPIIWEMNNFRVASSYGRGSDQSTNGSSDRACQAQSACLAWDCGSEEKTITPQWSATLPLPDYGRVARNPDRTPLWWSSVRIAFIPGIVSRAASPFLRRVWFLSLTIARRPMDAEGEMANETDAQAVYLEHLGSNSRP